MVTTWRFQYETTLFSNKQHLLLPFLHIYDHDDCVTESHLMCFLTLFTTIGIYSSSSFWWYIPITAVQKVEPTCLQGNQNFSPETASDSVSVVPRQCSDTILQNKNHVIFCPDKQILLYFLCTVSSNPLWCDDFPLFSVEWLFSSTSSSNLKWFFTFLSLILDPVPLGPS